MQAVLIIGYICTTFFVVQVSTWDINDEYYNKDYDENKDCKDEERVTGLMALYDKRFNMLQCFQSVSDKGVAPKYPL